MKDLSGILKDLRQKQELPQSVIADYLKITKQAYSLYELGKRQPDYDTLIKLADFFKVDINYLLRGGVETPATDNQLKFALFGDADIDDDILEDVKRSAVILKQLKEEKKRELRNDGS